MNKQLLTLSLVTSLAVLNVLSEAPCYSNYEEKKQRWDEMARKIDALKDGFDLDGKYWASMWFSQEEGGLPIDEGIKDTVTVLNLLGFKTSASCEGHIGLHGYPWVSFAKPEVEIEELMDKCRMISNAMRERETAIQEKYPTLSRKEAIYKECDEELNRLHFELLDVLNEMERLSKNNLISLKNLLATFYEQRSGQHDAVINIIEFGGPDEFAIASIGGAWQIVRDEATKATKLKEYQDEMRRFTEFLIDMYYSK
jgi:hypothetical protein